MKIVRVICFTLCLSMLSCSKIEPDYLETLQIIGVWKLESLTLGGITSMSVECCDYIEFMTDDIPRDSIGFFKALGLGYENIGRFEVSEAQDSLVFKWDTKQRNVAFEMNNDLLTLFYLEDSILVVEDWRKQ